MPDLMEGAVVFGLLGALLSRLIVNQVGSGRRMPLWGAGLVGVVCAYVGPPVFAHVQILWRQAPFLPEVTGGMVFIGLWVAFLVLFVFERKGQPRRVPIWAGTLIAVVAMFAVPLLLDKVTGVYQNASLRADVNHCTSGMLGKSQPRSVTNICDFAITVGMCLPGEKNPDPCAQSVTLEPGATAVFDPGAARLSSLPSNANGLTVVACRPPHRPSRNLRTTGRGYEGVCLPGG